MTEDKTNNVEKNGIKRREKVTTALFHSFYQFNVRNLKYIKNYYNYKYKKV